MPPNLPASAPSILHPRFKSSDLPVGREKRIAIDSLSHAFKKKGGFDGLRKKVWAEFSSSGGKENLTSRIHEAAEAEIERDPKLLSRERGTAATLIEGAVDRRGVYKDVETEIDRLLITHVGGCLETLRTIRREDVGQEEAATEEQLGAKTDEDYAKEFEARAAEREETRTKLADLDKQMETMRRKLIEAEEKKRSEARKKREEEAKQRRELQEEMRRAERNRRREEENRYAEEREKQREERRRRRREDDDAEREYKRRREERERRHSHGRERHNDSNRDEDRRFKEPVYHSRWPDKNDNNGDDKVPNGEMRRDPAKSTNTGLDGKTLDDIALQLLIDESKAVANQPRSKHDYSVDRRGSSYEHGSRRAGGTERSSVRRGRSGEKAWDRREGRAISRDRSLVGRRNSRHQGERHAVSDTYRESDQPGKKAAIRTVLPDDPASQAATTAIEDKVIMSQNEGCEEGEYRAESRSPSPSQVQAARASKDRDKDFHRKCHGRSQSRSPSRNQIRRGRQYDSRENHRSYRTQRSVSPINIDRYVPDGGVHRSSRASRDDQQEGRSARDRGMDSNTDQPMRQQDRQDRDGEPHPYRERERDRDRDRGHEQGRDRDRSYHSRRNHGHRSYDGPNERARDHSRDRDWDRDRDRYRDRNYRQTRPARTRSGSPLAAAHRGRDRDREHDRGPRDRDRDRDGDRDRKRGGDRLRNRDMERDLNRDLNRDRGRHRDDSITSEDRDRRRGGGGRQVPQIDRYVPRR